MQQSQPEAMDDSLMAELLSQRQQIEAQLRETQKRLELSLKGANLGTWTYRVGTDEFWADDRAQQMHGHDPGEVHTSAQAGANIHPEDRARAQATIAQAIQNRSKLQLEYRVIWRDGSVYWIASYAEFVLTGNQDEGMFYGVAQDITETKHDEVERKQVEAALRESEAKYRALFESLDEGFCIIELMYDQTGKPVDWLYLEANSTFERQSGLVAPGKTVSELIGKAKIFWLETYARIAETGEPERIENRVEVIDRWYNIYASRIGGAGSHQIAVVFNDITDRKRTEEHLRRAAEFDAFRVKLNDALRSLADPLAIQGEACRLLGEQLGIDRAYYVEINEAEDYARVEQDYVRGDSPSLVGTYPLSAYSWAMPLYRMGQAVIVTDSENSDLVPESEWNAMSAIRVIAVAAIPLVKKGVLKGALAVTESEPREWTDIEVELTRETAERIWAAVERARAEAALRKSEEQFRIFVTASSDIVYRMSADWREMLSLEGKNILVSTENPSQTWIETYIPQEEQLRVWTAIQESIRTKSTFELEHQVIQQDGLIGWTFSRTIPMLNEQGEILEWFGAASDVTERKQAEANRIQLIREQAAREEERQRAETLAELDRAKTLFFSNVSHEFRTPLTLILAPLQDVLCDRSLPPSAREQLDLAYRNALRLLKLVNTLLDFSRIEAGRIEAVYEPTDLALFTTELASVFRSAIERAGLRLIVDCPPLTEPVYVDREMWEKIVLNLISNAFKFTAEGEITVSLHPTNSNQILLQIQDTGAGIVPEHLPHLFKRFYQVRGTQARTHEGSGIGLALVDELVRLHGGTIEVNSTVGQGTCFAIALPFGTEHLPSALLGERIQPTRTLVSTATSASSYVGEIERWLPTEGNREWAIGNGEEQPAPTSDSSLPTSTFARVLLVDDNADMREYLTRILSEHVQVEAVADGAAALAAVKKQVPDLILSDVMMPGLDGFQLLQALRSDPRTREVPLILLSARAGEEAIVEGLEAGADDYLIKPFSAQELVSRVNAHLQMAQLRGEALQEARSTIRSRDEFISVVSHELNTPLVSILGWTRLLRSNPPSPAMLTKALDTIERNAILQGKLVQDLLDISRITAGKLRLNPQPVELKLVIETAIATVTQTAMEKGVNLTWQKNATDSIVVMGDGDRLQQVICNLLTNAIKFTPASGSVTVELSVVDDHSTNTAHAVIRVTDTGIGIAADFLPHVFERFRQARDSGKGLGLGLAIAHHLVELHRGTIHAESAGEGQGATFIVKLPIPEKG